MFARSRLLFRRSLFRIVAGCLLGLPISVLATDAFITTEGGFVFTPDDPDLERVFRGAPDLGDPEIQIDPHARFAPLFPAASTRDWLILFYDDADFNNAYDPLNELTESGFSSTNIDLVVLQDRVDGPAFIWHVTGGGERTLLAELGEVDMGHHGTLRDFIQFGKDSFPANRTMLCAYDHGGGHAGACIDVTNETTTILSMHEFEAAITASGGIDILAFTAPCLMGAIECVYELKDCVDVYIGSEELSGFILWWDIIDDMCLCLDDSDLLSNAQIGAHIVDLIATNNDSVGSCDTMGAFSCALSGPVAQGVDELATYLEADLMAQQADIAYARNLTWALSQVYYNDFNRVDFRSAMVSLQTASDDPYVDAKVDEIIAAYDAMLVAEWHGDQNPGARGISIFYPRLAHQYYDSYHTSSLNFTDDTHWDELLRAFYDGYNQTVDGTITDAVTGGPIAGATVTVRETGRQDVTGPDGSFSVEASIGSYRLDVTAFFHENATLPFEIVFGVPTDGSLSLEPRPCVDVVGRVTNQSGQTLAGVICRPSQPQLPAVTTDAIGKFTIAGAPVGGTFGLTIGDLLYHGTDYLTVTPEATGPSTWPVHAQLPAVTHMFFFWSESFGIGDAWTWGRPVVGPGTACGDTTCLGIGMDGGGFAANGAFTLESPPYVNYAGADQLHLSFRYWCDLEDGRDGVKLQFKCAVTDWFDLAPLNGYTHDNVAALDDAPGWSGASAGWQSAVFDLGPYTEDYILYRWVLMSDDDDNAGFYLIDDVALDSGDGVAPVSEDETLPVAYGTRISARPNPFNPVTRLYWTITSPGPLAIEVYDARGRLVRTLARGHTDATRGHVVFDGLDDGGRGLASGTYLVRIDDARGRVATTRVSLIK